LQGCNLYRAILDDVDFSGADMSGVSLGEYAPLRLGTR
jgi:uncharacterized protein YjbI with pentapeptide repeats